jgi:DNA-binding Lrp family transcriptional regulator
MIKELEKEGVIREYTMIPDFSKLGYSLLTVTLVKHRRDLDRRQLGEGAKEGLDRAQAGESPEMVMAETGMGLGYDAVVVAYEKDYSSHTKLIDRIRAFEHLQAAETQTFIVDLKDKVHYRPFTFQTLANHLLDLNRRKE